MGYPPVKIQRLNVGDEERLRTIRLLALQDSADAFATTFEEALGFSADDWKDQLQRLVTFVATADGHDVGLVRGGPHDDDAQAAYLLSLWVERKARRYGVGTLLIQTIVDWATTEGRDRLLLDVGEFNTPAARLYAKNGFIANGVTSSPPSPRDHLREIQMERRL